MTKGELDPRLAKLADQAGQRLRDDELELPAEVTQKLADARREAVALADIRADHKGRSGLPQWSRWAGVGAMAAGVLVVAVLLRGPLDSMPVADDLDLVVAQEVELLEELEFVAWMVAMDDAAKPPNAG
jgi:hypothetical protein